MLRDGALIPGSLQSGVAVGLSTIRDAWSTIRDEALAVRERMLPVFDGRADSGLWKVLPLWTEPEDSGRFPPDLCTSCRALTPRTTAIVESVPGILACMFSMVAPGGRILPHRHHNPFLTVSLCLQSGGDSFIVVGRDRTDYRDGELIVFDYRQMHEVVNRGHADRIALLLLVENRHGQP